MNFTDRIKYDIEKIRSMDKVDIYKLHQDTVILPDGLTYQDVVNRMEFLMKKTGFTPTSEQLHVALCCFEGYPVIIEAVPGAGKTTVTTFISICDYLIWGINKDKMLLTSFSNESSVGMQEKNLQFAQKIGCPPISRIKTMHGWYFNFLKEYKLYTRIPSTVQELSTLLPDEGTRMLRSSYVELTGDKTVTNNYVSQIYAVYSYIYDAMLTKEEEIKNLRQFKELNLEYETFMELIKKFDNTKLVLGKIDFTDMQVLFKELISKNEAIRTKIANHFDAILIDEAQDTSKLQLSIYALLTSEKSKKRFRLVGDNDQAIYRWRGTSKTIFEDIFTAFPDAQLLTLGYNMRSTDSIIEAGNKLISHNKNRVDKKMVSPRGLKGENVVVPCRSRLEAVDYIYNRLYEVFKTNKGNYGALKEHCVLVRNHNQGLWLVDKLLGNGIPVRLIGGYFPYNDKIILDLTDIMSAVLNPTDSKLGSVAIPKLCKDVKTSQSKQVLMQMSLGKKLYEVEFDCIPTRYNPEPSFAKDMEIIKKACMLNNPTVSELCKILIPLYRTGSYDFYAKKQAIDPEQYELIFDYLLEQNIPLNSFLLNLNNIRASLKNSEDLDIGFRLCSMHAAKGREYDNVYLLDCSSKSCPSERNLNSYLPSDAYDYLVEERNLFYVAITRARYNLYTTYNQFSPSIFNAESGLIKPEHVKNVPPLPKGLVNFIEYMENPQSHKEEPKLEQVSKMEDTVIANKVSNNKRKVVSSFTPHFVLNDHYASVLKNLKF